jgi:uncharacterized coiled-coil protein SlyX
MRLLPLLFLLACGGSPRHPDPGLMDKIIAVEEESFEQGKAIEACGDRLAKAETEIERLQVEIAALQAKQDMLYDALRDVSDHLRRQKDR